MIDGLRKTKSLIEQTVNPCRMARCRSKTTNVRFGSIRDTGVIAPATGTRATASKSLRKVEIELAEERVQGLAHDVAVVGNDGAVGDDVPDGRVRRVCLVEEGRSSAVLPGPLRW